MREMEKEMQIAQDQISARREEQERSTQSVKRLNGFVIISSYSAIPFCFFGYMEKDNANSVV